MNIKEKYLNELLISLVLTIFVGAIGFYFTNIFLLIYPAPSIVLGVKRGIKYSIINILLSTIAIFLLFGIYTIPYSMVFIASALIITRSINSNENLSDRILKSTAFTFIIIIIFMILSKRVFNYDIIDNLIQKNSVLFDKSLEEVKNMGIEYSKEQLEELNNMKPLVISFLRNSIFALILLGSFILNTVFNGIAHFIIRKKNIKILSPIKFSEFRVGIKFFLASIVILVLIFIINKINPSIYPVLVSNITIILYFIIFIQGLSVMTFILEKINIPRIFIYLLIFISLFSIILGILVFFIGMADLIFDFRKIKRV